MMLLWHCVEVFPTRHGRLCRRVDPFSGGLPCVTKLTYPVSLLLVTVVAIPCSASCPPVGPARTSAVPPRPAARSTSQATETWTIRGDGTGLRGKADQFQFVYKTLTGDGELVARVVSIDPPLADWSMAGVMIRVLLTPGSPSIFMGISANTDRNRTTASPCGVVWRSMPSRRPRAPGRPTAPYWVKVKRTGDVFAGFSSPDGKEWTERYSTTAAGIPQSIYIGYAVTSEVGGKLVTAVFDRGR